MQNIQHAYNTEITCQSQGFNLFQGPIQDWSQIFDGFNDYLWQFREGTPFRDYQSLTLMFMSVVCLCMGWKTLHHKNSRPKTLNESRVISVPLFAFLYLFSTFIFWANVLYLYNATELFPTRQLFCVTEQIQKLGHGWYLLYMYYLLKVADVVGLEILSTVRNETFFSSGHLSSLGMKLVPLWLAHQWLDKGESTANFIISISLPFHAVCYFRNLHVAWGGKSARWFDLLLYRSNYVQHTLIFALISPFMNYAYQDTQNPLTLFTNKPCPCSGRDIFKWSMMFNLFGFSKLLITDLVGGFIRLGRMVTEFVLSKRKLVDAPEFDNDEEEDSDLEDEWDAEVSVRNAEPNYRIAPQSQVRARTKPPRPYGYHGQQHASFVGSPLFNSLSHTVNLTGTPTRYTPVNSPSRLRSSVTSDDLPLSPKTAEKEDTESEAEAEFTGIFSTLLQLTPERLRRFAGMDESRNNSRASSRLECVPSTAYCDPRRPKNESVARKIDFRVAAQAA